MKRLLLFLFALVITTSLWAYKVEIDSIYYKLDETNKTAQVTYGDFLDNEYSGTVIIPSSVYYNSETYIVTSIGGGAFSDCTSLISVNIPNSVTSISERAFYNCSSLIFITFPNNVTSIGNYAFFNCSSLTSITLPNSVTTIDYCAFYNCTGLTSANIPDSVTFISHGLFNGCRELRSIKIHDNVTAIGNDAFSYCSKLTSIYIPDRVASIGNSAFSNCANLTSINIPNGIRTIENYTFSGCTGLTSITIPSSVTSIGYGAFFNCTSLNSVNIPNGVSTIGSYVFDNSSIYNDESRWENGVLYIDNCLIKAKSDIVKGSYLIKEETRVIADLAFSNCDGLTLVYIPKSIISIGEDVFYNCVDLKTVCNLSDIKIRVSETYPIIESPGAGKTTLCVYIPNSACEEAIPYAIGELPGGDWSNIETLKMKRCEGKSEWWQVTTDALTPENTTNFKFRMNDSIDWWSYEPKKSYLKIDEEFLEIKLNEHNNLVCIADCSDKVLYIKCNRWTSPCVSDGYHIYEAEEIINGTPIGDFIINETTLIKYIGKSDNVEIPDYITKIADGAFKDYNSLTSVIIPNSVTSIGNSAFSGCRELTTITIGKSIVNIGDSAFADCIKMRDLTLYAEEVPYINKNTFGNYNANLNVPCVAKEYYNYDYVFGNFKYIRCIEEEEEAPEDVEIEVDDNGNVNIKWPPTEGAYSYKLLVSQGGEVFCTLLFNSMGQLTSIDLSKRSASVGFEFTVTGLTEGSKYGYEMTALTENNEVLEYYAGAFITNGYKEDDDVSTSVDDINRGLSVVVSGGTISADAEFSIYNTVGQDVTVLNGSLQPGIYVVALGEDRVKVMVK